MPAELLRDHRGRALSPENPLVRGSAQNTALAIPATVAELDNTGRYPRADPAAVEFGDTDLDAVIGAPSCVGSTRPGRTPSAPGTACAAAGRRAAPL